MRFAIPTAACCLMLGACDGGNAGDPVPDASTADECGSGQVLACACAEGGSGIAFCEDGAWGECDCDDDGEFPRFCGLCHGDWDFPAPPADTQGNTQTTAVTVGAHRAHLAPSDWHRKVACDDCHVVPSQMESPGHLDQPPAELEFSAVAAAAGAIPAFDREAATCSGTYCHGSTTGPGGSVTEPIWTAVDGTQAVCGTCHGLPPGGSHPDETACAGCHAGVVDGSLAFVHPERHVDGKVDLAGEGLGCSSCHGGPDSPAPPVDTNGNSDPHLVTVGAHQSHLGPSGWHRELSCADCHVVPASPEVCHDDGPPAEVLWGPLATTGGAAPSFDRETAVCAGTYCHGSTLGAGGTNPSPRWNVVASGEVVCGACHGLPPCSGHPGSGPCAPCHQAVYDGENWIAPQLHIDGQVQVIADLPCGACHGMPPAWPHPANDGCGLCHGMVWNDGVWVDESLHDNGTVEVSGEGCTSCHGNPPSPADEDYPGGGGAHQRHVADLGLACSTCHGHDGSGPTHAEAATVLQANVDISFSESVTYPGGTTVANGGSPSFDHGEGNPTCLVGCHNPVVDDVPDLANAATWTDEVVPCSGCHERAGLSTPWNHDIAGSALEIRANCSTCHDITTHTAWLALFADPDPGDGIDPAAQGAPLADLCRTCHDGGGGTWFGGATPPDLSDAWLAPRAHESHGFGCEACHGYHGGNPGRPLAASVEETSCAGAACHDDVVAELGLAGAHTRHRVVDTEQSAGQLECVTCHQPHRVDDWPWRPVTDPDDGTLVAEADVPSGHFSTADGDTNAFCLDCHDGTWPGAIDINAEVAAQGVFTGSQFVRYSGGNPATNLHYNHVVFHAFACAHCHNAHSNTGTAGTNRGRLLYSYVTVNIFPYTSKGSCQLAGGPTGCHH
jgi:predicted CxxxxCH...CXXCH cytochrome family protein